MVQETVVIKNKYGLHARPASEFVNIASKYVSQIKIEKNGIEVDGKSIMGLLMIAAEKGDEITIKIDGKDEDEMKGKIVELLNGDLDKEM